MKQNINLKNIAKLSLQNENLSPLNAIDLSMLSQTSGVIYVNKSQYVEIVSSYALVLDRPEVLVLPMREERANVDGFISIYDKLLEKFSWYANNSFDGVSLIVAIKGCDNYYFKHTADGVIIDGSSTYDDAVVKLKKVGYERVDFIESPKQYCLKGGIIDIYSPLSSFPYRVCFYDGDFSIKNYNLSTGLSLSGSVERITLFKSSQKMLSISLKKILDQKKYTQILQAPAPKKEGLFLAPVSYNGLVSKKHKTVYSDSLFFSAYKYKDLFIVPNHYRVPTKETAQEEDVALEVGDVVCHEDFGVGVLKGFVGFSNEDGEDFVKIQYEDALVQLSVKSLYKLSFVSRETGQDVKLNSLNKRGVWGRNKQKLSNVVDDNIKELIDFYTNKNKSYRPPYISGGDIEKGFIADFPYEDTKDQAVVWSEIKRDLEKDVPMYRLVCGDVGFGKTELAIRSAFRVVVNKGRVLVMAPTSVLARQLFEVFRSRLGAFGVVVALYTGVCSAKNRNKNKGLWEQGFVDVLIGTTSLTYDVVFIKFASLIIIDEEHRFGVKDKEGFLEGYTNKDVLMMSATPIPRSLNLSLSGLNDISTLGTPPFSRRPIQTFVSYFNDLQIKRSVEYELNRGGQVFFVHNNISTIVSIKAYLGRLLPGAVVVVAHSKIGQKKLKNNILSFVSKKADILLCTSIIGSGIDIPNANTIIINGSHRFGLSQLHQIRGRVGRSSIQAYAYMLIPKGAVLSSRAKKRLLTIEKNVSLGSGYHIAKSDLNIRGAGLLFGFQQSGKSFDFGFEFYSKLVSKSLEKLSGSSLQSFVNNFVYKVSFPVCLSSNYIKSGFERLRSYRLLNSLYSEQKIMQFKNNLIDSYGPVPVSGENLINMRLLMVFCFELGLVSVVVKLNSCEFAFNNSFKRGKDLFKFLSLYSKNFDILSYTFDQREHITLLKIKYNEEVNLCGGLIVNFVKSFILYR